MRQIYILNANVQYGPFDESIFPWEEINLNTLIWYEGLISWTVLADDEYLFTEYQKRFPNTPIPNVTNNYTIVVNKYKVDVNLIGNHNFKDFNFDPIIDKKPSITPPLPKKLLNEPINGKVKPTSRLGTNISRKFNQWLDKISQRIPRTMEDRILNRLPKLLWLLSGLFALLLIISLINIKSLRKPKNEILIRDKNVKSTAVSSNGEQQSTDKSITLTEEANEEINTSTKDRTKKIGNQTLEEWKNWWFGLSSEWQAIFKQATKYSKPDALFFNKLLNLKEIDCNGKKIDNLEPIRLLPNLTKLYCGNNQITSLEPIKQLKKLTGLYCSSNRISSLEALQHLRQLKELYCGSNQINSLEPLKKLTNLTKLNLSNNQVSSLKPLNGLKNLKELTCTGNPISKNEIDQFKRTHPNVTIQVEKDGSLQDRLIDHTSGGNKNENDNSENPAEYIGNRTLSEWKSWWSTLSPNWKKVFSNAVNNPPPGTADFFEKVFGLKKFDCDNQYLTSLEPIGTLRNLQVLSLRNNQIISLEPLKGMPSLVELYCNNNRINTLEPIEVLNNLIVLDCSNNQLSSLRPLENLKKISKINCSNNQIENLSPLYGHTKLKELNCAGNPVAQLIEFRFRRPTTKVIFDKK